jgi:hypothetical protein
MVEGTELSPWRSGDLVFRCSRVRLAICPHCLKMRPPCRAGRTSVGRSPIITGLFDESVTLDVSNRSVVCNSCESVPGKGREQRQGRASLPSHGMPQKPWIYRPICRRGAYGNVAPEHPEYPFSFGESGFEFRGGHHNISMGTVSRIQRNVLGLNLRLKPISF